MRPVNILHVYLQCVGYKELNGFNESHVETGSLEFGIISIEVKFALKKIALLALLQSDPI